MPRPVMAAALFFNGSLMSAGIQIIASRPITLRVSLIVGFSILLALSVLVPMVDEAIDHVSANAQGPVEIAVGSDSFDVKVAL